MSVSAILKERDGHKIISCTTDALVSDVAKLLSENRIGAVPVMENDKLVGVFSGFDMVRRLADEGAAVLDARIGDIMTAPAITISANESVSDALTLMGERSIRHLPVVDGDEMIGFVSIVDLVKFRSEMAENEAAAMKQYITYGGGQRRQ